MTDRDFLKRAIDLAHIHAAGENSGPFAAIVVKKNVIIAEAWNQVVANNDPTAHAEIIAIRKACQAQQSYNLEGCTLFSSCEPCPMCLSAIYWARMDGVIYAASKEDAAYGGFDDSLIYDEMEKEWSARKIKSQRMLAKAGRAVFETWRHNPRKIEY
ncbi:nucleoside deaminase [candidate division KSB1 bacterium]|nr:nucleoside deaminase [candidate division KSB1 bacterium]RQW01962.1 MAG: nucleoside deaminase [candidate division KSB1 bacterium]